MQHLCKGSLRKRASLHAAPPCQVLVRFCALRRIKHMLHRLCGPPSIPLSFNLAAVLPRRCAYRVSYDTEQLGCPTSSTHRLRRGLPGYLILFAPHAFAHSVSIGPGRRLRHRCSSQYLRISPLHWEFHDPLPNSSEHVLSAAPRLSPGISRLTVSTAYAPFTPSHSEQR